MDAHYGEQPWLLDALQDRHLRYYADIAKDTRVFVGTPMVAVKELSSDRFRMTVSEEGAIAVMNLVTQKINLTRSGNKGYPTRKTHSQFCGDPLAKKSE